MVTYFGTLTTLSDQNFISQKASLAPSTSYIVCLNLNLVETKWDTQILAFSLGVHFILLVFKCEI